MSEDNKRKNIAVEMAESDGRMRAARRLAEDPETRKDAVARAYYAAFHAARAVLLTRGIEPRSHRGVRERLRSDFAGAGGLPVEAATALDHLEAARLGADYAAGREFSSEETLALLADAETVIAAARAFLTSGGWIEQV